MFEGGDTLAVKPTAKAPKNGWLEYDPFLLGRLVCRGYVSFREVSRLVYFTYLRDEINLFI